MRILTRRFSDFISIMLMIAGLMIAVAIGAGLLMISIELSRFVTDSISEWWGKLLAFLVVLVVVYGVAGGTGSYLWSVIDFSN